MTDLAKAIRIAAIAHESQIDKAGQPYVLHVLRVMLRCTTPDARIAAVLHDLVEDTDWTLDRLRDEGFSESIVAVIDSLTRRPSEDYFDYVRRALQNPLAREVKRADLLDNLDTSRIPAPTARDWARIERYQQAMLLLEQAEAHDYQKADTHDDTHHDAR